jgi:hypothetical protein
VPQILEYERRTWGLDLRNEAIGFFYATRTSSKSVYSVAPAVLETWNAEQSAPDRVFEVTDCLHSTRPEHRSRITV